MLINESLQYKLFENAEGLVAREARVRDRNAISKATSMSTKGRISGTRVRILVGLRECAARSNP